MPTPPAAGDEAFASPESLLSAIIDSSDDAIVSKSLEGVVTSWNQGAERIFGYSADEMVGRSIMRLIPPERRGEEPQILEQVSRGIRVENFDTQRVTKSGTYVDVSLTISPVRNRAGKIVGASKIARDITQRKQTERALQHSVEAARGAVAEAERQARLKDEFLATLSHELRTPLQAILGWTQLLLANPADGDEVRQGLTVIDRNARTQARVVNDLLDMSHILTGEFEIDLVETDFNAVVRAAVKSAEVEARLHGLTLVTELEPGARTVLGDAARLGQILENLLGNALKFTPPGGRITLRVENVEGWVRVMVRDTGVGISPDFLPHVFDRFRQADASTRRQHGGLGLGLAIVKTLVELHEGSISAESEGIAHGATFWVDLPLAEVSVLSGSDGTPLEAEEARRLPRLDGLSLLVVDDEIDARDMLQRVLVTLGAEVRAAGSMQEALSCIASRVPDLLISDIEMPGHDGYELIRRVRSLPPERGGRMPALALTAYSSNDDRMRIVTEGFQMCLAKPTDAMELLGMVKVLTRSTTAEAGEPR
ncbi:MAG: PAS domain S-box protein [Verrucomicrobia bacterium]|nr:PAS domain S-box protein [Verrucomicrobiota bacterium]